MSFFKDKNGHIVIWQRPNIPILGWLLFKAASIFTNNPDSETIFSAISTAFIFTWAYLEITDGASYFRRVLGAVVMLATVIGLIT